MNFLKTFKYGPSLLGSISHQSYFSQPIRRFRKPSPCDMCLFPPDQKPCFDMANVTIERGNQCHAKLIKSFLYTQHWPREPSVCALWMALNCPYLEILTDKYAHSGDRFLAFERQARTNEKKLIGVLVAYQVSPWMINEYEEWAHYTYSKPERYRMYFCAHCLKNPKLFEKYKTNFIYDIEILGTAAEVTGQGVATALLRAAIEHADLLRYPLIQVIALSQYVCKVCERCGMKREWSMDYKDFVDDNGQRVFYPRRPHHTVSIYVKFFDKTLGGEMPCKPQYYDS